MPRRKLKDEQMAVHTTRLDTLTDDAHFAERMDYGCELLGASGDDDPPEAEMDQSGVRDGFQIYRPPRD